MKRSLVPRSDIDSSQLPHELWKLLAFLKERGKEGDGKKTNSNSFVIRSIRIPASILSAVFQRYLFDLFSTCRRDVCRYNRYIPVGNRNRSFPPSPRVSSSSSPPRREADLSHRKKGEEREEFRFSANVNGNVRHGRGWRLDDRAKTFRGFFSSGRIESNAL